MGVYGQNSSIQSQIEIVSEQPLATNNNFDVAFIDPKSQSARNENNIYRNKVTKSIQDNIPHHMSTCRTLQRKLEMKVERAKRNYTQFNQKNANLNEVLSHCHIYIFKSIDVLTHVLCHCTRLYIIMYCVGGSYEYTKCQCKFDTNQPSSNTRCTGKCATRRISFGK